MKLGRLLTIMLISPSLFAAFSTSSHYQLQSYGVNSGSTNSSASTSYKLQGSSGEISGSPTASANRTINSGGIKTEQASVPPAPTISNGGSTYYNELNFIVNTTGNPSDATYAIAVSTTSNFTVTNYVQANGTLGAGQVYQSYAAWGSGSGSFAIGLNPNTAYWFKVSASNGAFTPSAFGPSATASTVNPALSFSVSPNTLNLGVLAPGSVVSSSSVSYTFTTNANNGGTVYMAGSATGLVSASNSNYTIQVSPPSGDLSSLSEGFGFQGSTSAPLSTVSPYNGSSNVVGAIFTSFVPVFTSSVPVPSGSATGTAKALAKATTPSGTDYTDTLTFVAAASY